jgi:nucleoid-associated protein YgaU
LCKEATRCGDNAEEFDVTMEKIIEVNQISDPNTLTVGQTIIIPSKPLRSDKPHHEGEQTIE